MVSRFLDEQHIRRRRHSSRPEPVRRHERILDRRQHTQLSLGMRERLGLAVRVAVMVLAIGGLVTGLVIVGSGLNASDVLAEPVVDDLVRRASMGPAPAPAVDSPIEVATLPAEDSTVPGLEPSAPETAVSDLPQVEFERTEDYEYVVAEGETLSGIAHQFNIPYEFLAQYNGIENADSLMPEQHLMIPSEDLLPLSEPGV